MIETVFTFGFVSALFELVILMKVKPRTRLRILGSKRWVWLIHILTFTVNIIVHFGTITGSMSAIVAALASFITVPLVKTLCGTVTQGRYLPGIIKYTKEELV